jgi:hypothetical protein
MVLLKKKLNLLSKLKVSLDQFLLLYALTVGDLLKNIILVKVESASSTKEKESSKTATVVSRKAITTFHQRALRTKSAEKPKPDAYTVEQPLMVMK